jgi:hypothetical protein
MGKQQVVVHHRESSLVKAGNHAREQLAALPCVFLFGAGIGAENWLTLVTGGGFGR